MYQWTFSIESFISGDSVSHFFGIVMLICKIGFLTQKIIGLGRVTFSSKGPMRSVSLPCPNMIQYFVWTFAMSIIISTDSASLFIILLIW